MALIILHAPAGVVVGDNDRHTLCVNGNVRLLPYGQMVEVSEVELGALRDSRLAVTEFPEVAPVAAEPSVEESSKKQRGGKDGNAKD